MFDSIYSPPQPSVIRQYIKVKRSQANRLTPSFPPVGVTGFEPATTRPPDFKDYGLIMSDYQELSFFFCFLVYTMVYNSVNCCC